MKIYRFVIIKYFLNETACHCYGCQEIIFKHLQDFDLQSNKFFFELRKILIQHFLINETRIQFVTYFLNHKNVLIFRGYFCKGISSNTFLIIWKKILFRYIISYTFLKKMGGCFSFSSSKIEIIDETPKRQIFSYSKPKETITYSINRANTLTDWN